MATRCRHSTSSARGEEVRCVTAHHHTGDIENQCDSGTGISSRLRRAPSKQSRRANGPKCGSDS